MKKSNPVPFPDRDYQSEDDHRTLMRASEIQMDHGRMKGVRKHQRKEEKRMSLMKKTMLQSGRR